MLTSLAQPPAVILFRDEQAVNLSKFTFFTLALEPHGQRLFAWSNLSAD
jgi:hypothetical protein